MSPTRRESLTPSSSHAGVVGIIGKPNVGKSAILNAVLNRKVSIVSPRPQTTRFRIIGILTRPEGQLIFVDTPGWHQPKRLIGKHMMATTKGVIQEVDVLLTVIDATTGLTREDEWLFGEVRRAKRPAVLAINKVDAVDKRRILPLIDACVHADLFAAYVPISALTGENLEALLDELMRRMPSGPRGYEADQLMDQPVEQMMAELIREQALLATRQEVPQAVAVRLEEVTKKERLTFIRATMLVEREGQKAILIGHKGRTLKQIGQAARLELERLLGVKVFLELWVKVAEGWRSNPTILRELGF
ncbi:MAG TPA: GTPase Era [Candidatus Omnitrophica bacterium]|nr:MAG: GTPase Era [Omnitrophica WOR_2 bacterium GWA2_63_20]OGX17410.1 MAG: GTPase Era [Omnitrophica WOR_2 bacterium GWF2_63_9]OGX32346.1 MAG: GTPase Era [Omnitrophica WOR_2 bacterium RIFCSPHIGHO2_12_FULL_64_13]OGX35251.1 MAG: GTPase Era [Omnitrophica WOR_2 bacterium RIFCSPHIGHO2_02_FULL_63_39]OGX45094.1 MAG: GTPase Era [Omnitrophica WOR_2 bacterium RIFCSPLOWO2_02_FULL_63_16]OGX48979.1 MAG: GTPase Era [Omnitrophica WOR_2 bacterium RIFCSPLOWO2_12_FULL_63_16]HAM41607.1 GTPase Era [Candidatus Om